MKRLIWQKQLGILVCWATCALLNCNASAEAVATTAPQPAAQSSVAAVPVSPPRPVGTVKQQAWTTASDAERVRLAELIGEEGAENFARSKGLTPILLKQQKGVVHGPDQIWMGEKGWIYVIEAKGGSSPINTGYGYVQGTCEYAIASAQKLLLRPNLPEETRNALIKVLEAASRGRLTSWVVRTLHSQGEAQTPILAKETVCTKQASALASSAMETLGIEGTSLAKVIASGGKVVLKVGGAATGVLGGTLQLTDGVQQMRDGHAVEGGTTAVLGAGNIAANTLIMIGKVAEAGSVGAGVAMIDGGKDVCLGIVSGSREKTVVGSIKLVAGGAMYTGHPVVVVIGGVTYAGIVIYEHREELEAGGRVAMNWAQSRFDKTWNDVGAFASTAANVASDTTDAVWNASMKAAHNAGTCLSKSADASWNASVAASESAGAGLTKAKDATWNASAATIESAGSCLNRAKDASWNAGATATQSAGSFLSNAADTSWNASAAAADRTAACLSNAKNATWNASAAAMRKIGAWGGW